ncbi:MAG TPA: Stk1 family PASTA domain-containing Ser/Thr kinase [Gaiellaceae bacterium]|jgi:serine/threonine-protein kinase
MAVSDTLINTLFDGRYRILRKLGSGGMANVYLAEDEELGRRVAIKILNERYANDELFNERFRREAKSAAGLSHPNIVSIYDRGEADGIPYIAMEVIEGRSLKELILTRGALPVGQAIDYAKQILGALRFAHRHGIIHRDIKPHNILLGNEDRLKVTDFGIARAGASQMTEVGSIMGTAQYLSPEQARGAPVTAASDLYSLGIVLYELLTGQVPFTGDSAIEIAMKHLNEIPRPPSAIRPEITPELDQVVLRALAKNPEDRYQSADELQEDLDRVEAGLPLSPETATAATSVLAGVPATEATQVLSAPPTAPAPRQPATPHVPPPIYPPRYGRDEPPRRRRRWLPWLIVILLLAGTAAAGWYVYTQIQDELKSSEPIAVPFVVGLREQPALDKLHGQGFETKVVRGASRTVPVGVVIAQNPNAGTRIQKGDTVQILVSIGPPKSEVPDVVGESYADALQILGNANFKVKKKQKFSPTVEEGDVISQNPAAGAQAVDGSTVTVVVSKGQELALVPDVVGQDQQSASAALQGAGFLVNAVEVPSQSTPGTVVAQNPQGGEQIPKGSTVRINVARGPTEKAVPDVTNRTQEDAQQQLEAAGFKVKVVKQDTDDPTKDDVVIDQNPHGGDQAADGSTVTITVGHFKPSARGNGTGNSGPGGNGGGPG